MKHSRTGWAAAASPKMRQRGHMDFSAPIGWALSIVGVILTSGGLWMLWAGIRMLVRWY